MKQVSTTDSSAIKRIKVEYYQQLYVHKFDNLKEMDQFLRNTNYQSLIKMIDNLNSPVTIKEIELIKENLLKNNSEPSGFTGELY